MIAVAAISFCVGYLMGGLVMYYFYKARHNTPYTDKRQQLEATVDALAQANRENKDGAQIIMPNPVRTAFDEGKINSIDDIIV